MRAVGFKTPGGPEVLEVVELPDPVPGPGQVRIRVHAAAVNPTDTVRRSRAPVGGDDEPVLQVPGMDAAGVLEEIGAEVVIDAAVGDRVIAVVVPSDTHGAYAEQVVVPAESVVRAPSGFTDIEAATLPMNGLTARLGLDTLALEPGGILAVTGAAGVMGGYAVQLGKAEGLTVVADAAESDRKLVADLGADVVLPRGEQFPQHVAERFPDGVDAVIDGALMHQGLVPAVRDGGVVITVRGYEKPGERGISFQPVWVAEYATAQATLDELRELTEKGMLSLRTAERFLPEQAPEAHRRLEAGGVRGRLILEF